MTLSERCNGRRLRYRRMTMPREDAFSKARRLLAEGRVIVKAVTPNAVTAIVRGDSGKLYAVSGEYERWSCNCSALSRCSHVMALQLVTLEPLPRTGPGPKGAA